MSARFTTTTITIPIDLFLSDTQSQNSKEIEKKMQTQLLLSKRLIEGSGGIVQDKQKGLILMNDLLAQHYSNAYIVLGNLYLNGKIIDIDKEASEEQYKIQCLRYAVIVFKKGIEEINSLPCKINFAECILMSAQNPFSEIEKDYAIKMLKEAAEAKSTYAQFRLAYLLKNGFNIAQDTKKALELFEWVVADKANSNVEKAYSARSAGNCYEHGIGCEINNKKACEYYKIAADMNDLAAQILYGNCLRLGIGIEKNLKLALERFEKAVNIEDKNNKGLAYYFIGMVHDENNELKKAFQAFKIAVELDCDHAKLMLAIYFLKRQGYQKKRKAADDHNKCVELLKSLLHSDSPQIAAKAKYWMGYCHLNGIAMAKNVEQGLQYYKEAAEQNNLEALWVLYHYNTSLQSGCDPALQIKYLEKAIALDDKNAKIEMAKCLLLANGIEQDEKKAIELLTSIGSDCKGEGLNSLAICHLMGWGVQKNANRAVKLLQSAIKQGSDFAAINLGYCYLFGIGVERDFESAYKHFIEARKINATKLTWQTVFCMLNGLGVEKNINKAIENLIKLAKDYSGISHGLFGFYFCSSWYFSIVEAILSQSSPETLVCVGLCYLMGWGVIEDASLIEQIFQKTQDEMIKFLSDQSLSNEHRDLIIEKLTLKHPKVLLKLANYTLKDAGSESECLFVLQILTQMVDAGIANKNASNSILFECALEAAAICGPYYKYGRVVQKDPLKATQYLSWAANYGNAKAQLYMAHYYEDSRLPDGQPNKEHQELALTIYHQLAQKKMPEAFNDLARCYSEGIGVIPDFNKSFDLFHQANVATGGRDPDVLCNLAKCYLGGEGVKASPQMGVQLLQMAAKNYSKKGEIEKAYGLLYKFAKELLMGTGEYSFVRWPEGTVKLLLFAVNLTQSNKNPPQDIYSPLAYCYFSGLGLPGEDHSKGLEIINIAIKQNFPDAINNLAWWQMHRLNSNKEEAFQLNEKAAQAGSKLAYLNRAWYYLLGFGVKQDKMKAAQLFNGQEQQTTNEKNMSNTKPCFGVKIFNEYILDLNFSTDRTEKLRNALGLCHFYGWGLEQNYKKAFSNFKLAASKNLDAKWMAAYCLSRGLGKEKNIDKSFKYYQEILNELSMKHDGDSRSRYERVQTEYICELYNAHVLFTSEQFIDNIRFLEYASEKNIALAKVQLATFYREGIYFAKDPKKVLQLLDEASDLGDSNAQYFLGRIYEKGTEVPKDLELAMKYYIRAASLCHAEANERVQDLKRSQKSKIPDKKPAEILNNHSKKVFEDRKISENLKISQDRKVSEDLKISEDLKVAHELKLTAESLKKLLMQKTEPKFNFEVKFVIEKKDSAVKKRQEDLKRGDELKINKEVQFLPSRKLERPATPTALVKPNEQIVHNTQNKESIDDNVRTITRPVLPTSQ